MNQVEIQEISDAFASAWEDNFSEAFFVAHDPTKDVKDELYDEIKTLGYDLTKKKKVFVSLKELESLDVEGSSGDDPNTDILLTFVTLELPEFNDKGIFEFTDEFSKLHYYKVTDVYKRVMFGQNRIFTKAKVVELSNYLTGELK